MSVVTDENAEPPTRPAHSCWDSLPMSDETATLVVSNYALHHLDDPGNGLALSKARRLLVPGGRLAICDMRFSVSLRRRERAIIAGKMRLLSRRGPAGLVRIASNSLRLIRRRWEQPSPPECWSRMLAARGFIKSHIEILEHEAGIAVAHRPPRRAR